MYPLNLNLKEMEKTMFKFIIGDKVNHRGYKKNLIIQTRIEMQDFCSTELYYDCIISDPESCKVLDQVPEFWLDEGHRVE